ncbi:MAG: glycosyltransferase [Ktedonobacteraceae bacterium]|jgi:D-inositol-3-phosphate glycosyltransferase
MSLSIAMLSVHTSPLDAPGRTKDAGGMNVYIRALANELGNRRISVDIFTRWTNTYTPRIVQLSPFVRVIHIKAGPQSTVHKNDLYQYMPTFIQQIDEFSRTEATQYDVVHSHYWLSGVAGHKLAQMWDVPHVTMFHTLARLKQLANPNVPEPYLRMEMEQQLIHCADCIIAPTTEERTQLIRYCGATPNQVEVIPCGVDLNLFTAQDKQQARKKLGLKRHQPTLLFVGRLDPFKGPDLLLRAAAMMAEKAQILIVGGKLQGDKDVEVLRQLAQDLNIDQRVHFLGACPQDELPLIYSAADVVVVPSYHESFGLVAVEALACGTPVVATRAGGLMSIVRHAETGYLVPRCPGFFAEKLDTLLGNPALLAQMSRAARPSVLHFSWQNVANQVSRTYDALLTEARQLVAQ